MLTACNVYEGAHWISKVFILLSSLIASQGASAKLWGSDWLHTLRSRAVLDRRHSALLLVECCSAWKKQLHIGRAKWPGAALCALESVSLPSPSSAPGGGFNTDRCTSRWIITHFLCVCVCGRWGLCVCSCTACGVWELRWWLGGAWVGVCPGGGGGYRICRHCDRNMTRLSSRMATQNGYCSSPSGTSSAAHMSNKKQFIDPGQMYRSATPPSAMSED
jgi:hypothetical protein